MLRRKDLGKNFLTDTTNCANRDCVVPLLANKSTVKV